MKIDFEKETVGEIVRKDYRAARIFKSHKIDFCCGGGKSLAQVCSERKISEADILSALKEATVEQASTSSVPDYDQWPLDLLADYIEKKHHRYVESTIPVLMQYLKKLAAVHGPSAPELVEIADIFTTSAGNLAMHMKKEELVLFPFIRKMVNAEMAGGSPEKPHFGSVENPIAGMEAEHETEGEHFRQIDALTKGYSVPEWGCNTYHVTMQLLKEFEEDLHLHIHLENNVLFPKAMDLEQKLMS